MSATPVSESNDDLTIICGPRYAVGPHTAVRGSLRICGGKLRQLHQEAAASSASGAEVDLSGFLLLPGLINAHDHLQYALHPRIGDPPYNNYVEWGDDIHTKFPELIAQYNSVPKEIRVWWGGLRNLLCGVTSVCHHDPSWPALHSEGYPVRVLSAYGWAHSVGLDPDIRRAWDATPKGSVFVIHMCEGTDELARTEVASLDELGMLNAETVVVHGLALDKSGIALLQRRQASLVLCLSSNQFLYHSLPDVKAVRAIEKVALGNDSPLSAAGDVLDEVRFAIERAAIPVDVAYQMITELAAAVLRLCDGEGHIRGLGKADLIAVRDTGVAPCEKMRVLSWRDVECVLIAGKVQLASEDVWHRLPRAARQGLEPLWIDGIIRWLRAPVRQLVQEAEAVLGPGMVRLNGRKVLLPEFAVSAPAVVVGNHGLAQNEPRL